MTQETTWNVLGMIGVTPWIQDFFFSIFLVRVCWQLHGVTEKRIFMHFSGYRH